MAPSLTRVRMNMVASGVKAAVKHFTSRDYPQDWDLAFHIQFGILRGLLSGTGQWTIEDFQEMTTKKVAPPKGTWTIPVEFSATESQKLLIESEVPKTIAKLEKAIEGLDIDVVPISGEWQGARHVPEEKASKWSIQEQYDELYTDTKDGPVVLYLHGGAYIVCSIDSHRPLTTRMAADCGGRLFSVKYRLAPQSQFPAALIDAVLAYKYLIDPPPGALHKAIDPSKIVIAGDSAGGGLAFALMVFLAYSAPTFPLPAGLIGISPWLDLTHSFPSARVDRGVDYLPNPWEIPVSPKPSPSWPPREPRYHFYTDIPLHPLVSPVLAADNIPDFPPVLIVVGDNEYLRDESFYFAATFAKNGGRIRLQNYMSMPHVFQMFRTHPSVNTSFKEFARFIKDVTNGTQVETQISFINGKGVADKTPLDLEKYSVTYSKAELMKRMEAEVERRFKRRSLSRNSSK